MIRPGTIALLAALVSTLATASWWTVRSLGRPKSIMETKVAEAHRVLYYRMTPERGPSIRLSGAENAIRLITHVILPPGTLYDPTRRIRYGIRLVITDGDREVWKQDIYTLSRQSKDNLQEGLWRYENSFVRDTDVQITDDRIFHIHLPSRIPTNSILTTTLLGDEASEGIIRIYNQERRDELEQEVAARALPIDRQQAKVWSNTMDPWSLVPMEEKLSRVRYRTERMSALGERGLDYETRTVYYTGFRLPASALERQEAIKIHRHRAAAINIVGPTEIAVRVEPLDEENPLAGEVSVGIDSLSASHVNPLRPSALALGETTTLFIAEGLHSVHLTTSSEETLAVWVTGTRNALFGAPPELGDEIDQLRPDEIHVPVIMVGHKAELMPVQVAGLGSTDPLQRLLRVEVRLLDTSQPERVAYREFIEHTAHVQDDSELFTGSLKITVRDTSGKIMRTLEQPLRSVRAPFEWLDRPDMQPIEISEPVDVLFISPPGIGSMEIESSRPAIVRLFRYLPGDQLHELPYREAVLARGIQWRYARLEKRIWWPMRALNQQALEDNEQTALLVAQARLVERKRGRRHGVGGDADEDGHGNDESGHGNDEIKEDVPSAVIAPLESPEQHMIIEPIPPERAAEARAEWGPGLAAEVQRGRDAAYVWDAPGHQNPDQTPGQASGHRRARIHYWADPADVGKKVTIVVDGNPAESEELWTASGFWELGPLPPGEHRVQVTTSAASLRAFVDRPPVQEAAPLYRIRTVFAMERVPLRLRVIKPMRGRAVLYAVIYAPWKEANPDIQIRSVVSGGRPKRLEGQVIAEVTRADRQVSLPRAKHEEPAEFMDRQSGSPGYARVLAIPIGEDLVPGTHFVEIYSVTGRRLWVRFYVTNHDPEPAVERVLQWNFRDDP